MNLATRTYLDDDEAGAAVVRGFEVDGTLVVRDIEAWNAGGSLFELGRSGDGEAEANGSEGDSEELHGRINKQQLSRLGENSSISDSTSD